ncbi:MAG: IS110 family transposase [Acidimicrobiaceae bacterium]|nr:IS110 family transposase [Acidimicrobiaceae bacterium]
MHDRDRQVTGGVDTHGEVHVAAVIDATGPILATSSFAAALAGCRGLLGWLRRHGRVVGVGVEGTGSYGAGLARCLTGEGVAPTEVNRPDRQRRRRHGKCDTVDAEAAARAALNGDAARTPTASGGPVDSVRVLRVARRSAIKARTQAANQIRDLIVTAPDRLRSRLRGLDTDQRVAVCSRFRTGETTDPGEATKLAVGSLARRHLELSAEIAAQLAALCAAINPALLAAHGVGPEVAATLLAAAGANPARMGSDAAFAALCGVSPVEAFSGKVTRHRLNSGGDPQANNALWRIVVVPMSSDTRTHAYVARRTREGKSKREIIGWLKRHIACEVFRLLTRPATVPLRADLRAKRRRSGLTLADAAQALGTWPTRLSEIERGLAHNAELSRRYELWLQPDQAA